MAAFFDNFSSTSQHSCTSSLQRLAYRKESPRLSGDTKGYEQQLGVLRNILKSTDDLHELALDLHGWETQRMSFPRARTVVNTLLVVNRLDNLRTLELSVVDMLAADLIKVSSRCMLNLSKLTMDRVSVDSGWAEKLQLLLTMPKLAYLGCNLLVTEGLILNGQYSFVMFEGLPDLRGHNYYWFECREEVIMGLRKMLEQPLRYLPLSDGDRDYWPDVS